MYECMRRADRIFNFKHDNNGVNILFHFVQQNEEYLYVNHFVDNFARTHTRTQTYIRNCNCF